MLYNTFLFLSIDHPISKYYENDISKTLKRIKVANRRININASKIGFKTNLLTVTLKPKFQFCKFY